MEIQRETFDCLKLTPIAKVVVVYFVCLFRFSAICHEGQKNISLYLNLLRLLFGKKRFLAHIFAGEF